VKGRVMKIRMHGMRFISLLVLPAYIMVASEPVGTGILALNVDDNHELKTLAEKIGSAIKSHLEVLKERMGRGVREELQKYGQFEKEIKAALARFDETELDVTELQTIAQRNFPSLYPAHIKDPIVHDKHRALWRIYNFKPFVKREPREGGELSKHQKRRVEKMKKSIIQSKRGLLSDIEQTKSQFNALLNALNVVDIIPTKILHITLCECGAAECNRPQLKKLFSPFYETKTDSVEFTIEEVAVYSEGPGWIILKIKSPYLDKLVARLRRNGTFQCSVRTPYRAHISILKFDKLEGGPKNTILQQMREFLTIRGPELLTGFEKPYCINIKEFGIKTRGIEFL